MFGGHFLIWENSSLCLPQRVGVCCSICECHIESVLFLVSLVYIQQCLHSYDSENPKHRSGAILLTFHQQKGSPSSQRPGQKAERLNVTVTPQPRRIRHTAPLLWQLMLLFLTYWDSFILGMKWWYGHCCGRETSKRFSSYIPCLSVTDGHFWRKWFMRGRGMYSVFCCPLCLPHPPLSPLGGMQIFVKCRSPPAVNGSQEQRATMSGDYTC